MKPFVTLEAVACPLPFPNIDTDQIIPARFMRKPRHLGYERFFLHDRRFDREGNEIPNFPLNQGAWRKAEILVAGSNFGCGSSREPAVYALQDFGIQSVIATSFGDIHRSNAIKNGLLPVELHEAAVEAITNRLLNDRGLHVKIDLRSQTVQCAELEYSFQIDPFSKQCLLDGTDDIDVTLAYQEEILRFEKQRTKDMGWTIPRDWHNRALASKAGDMGP